MKMISIKRVVVIYVLVLVSAIMLFGCSSESNNGRQLNKDSFSKEYSDSDGFKTIQDDVISLYNMVENAYAKSDKSQLSSFSLDTDRFDKLYNKITDAVDDYSRDKSDAKVMVSAAYNVALLNERVAGLGLLKAAGVKENSKWFTETDDVLLEVYNSFTDKKVEKTETQKASKEESSSNPFVGTWDVTKIYDVNNQSVNSSLSGSFIVTIKSNGNWSMETSTSEGKQNTSGTWDVQTVQGTETCILNEGSTRVAICIIDDNNGEMNMAMTGRDDYMFVLESR